MQGVRAEAHFFQPSGPEIFDQDIGAFDQPQQNFNSVGFAQVEGQAFFVAGVGLPMAINAVILPGAQRIALSRCFDLDDLGTEIGQLQGQHIAGDQPRQIEDADAIQRAYIIGIKIWHRSNGPDRRYWRANGAGHPERRCRQ